MLRDEIVAYLEEYARSFDVPLIEGVRATGLEECPEGFELVTDAATVTADQVVLATGPYQLPKIPRFAERLPKDLVQLHSSQYRNPGATA